MARALALIATMPLFLAACGDSGPLSTWPSLEEAIDMVNSSYEDCKWTERKYTDNHFQHVCSNAVQLEVVNGKNLSSILIRVNNISRPPVLEIARRMGIPEQQTTDVIQGREGAAVSEITRMMGKNGNLLFFKLKR